MPPSVSFRQGRALLLGGACLLFAFGRLLGPWIAHGPVICPVRAVTGFPCPGCGMTRAFVALAQGHAGAALALNAASVPLAAAVLAALPLLLVELVRGRPLARWRFLSSQRLAVAVAVLLAGYHVARTVWWLHTGALQADYLSGSWWWVLARRAGWLA